MSTYCNPLNIPYQYQHYGKGAHREASEPSLVCYQDRYYLFASMCGGFYWSDDLLSWQYYRQPALDLYAVAPSACEIGGRLVLCASPRGKTGTFLLTDDPFGTSFEKRPMPSGCWFPSLFADEDGRVFLYWTSETRRLIYGAELDSESLAIQGERAELILGQPGEHGWERRSWPDMPEEEAALGAELVRLHMRSVSYSGKDAPFLERPFVYKRAGKYYLTYTAPAGELGTCGMGVYVGEDPLGPFTYQAHNPVSFKPGGFVTGAGRGSMAEDRYGNLWLAASVRVAANAPFERRIALFPAGVDADGVLFCPQGFGDAPTEIPAGPFDPAAGKPKWMLLSYQKAVEASSALPGHEPALAVNEDIRTCWCAEKGAGEWLRLDLGAAYTVCAVQLNLADVGAPVIQAPSAARSDTVTGRRWIDIDPFRRTRWLLEGSEDGETWRVLLDKRAADTDLGNDYIELEGPETLRYLRVTAAQLPYNQRFAVSGLRVFGFGGGDAPERVRIFSARKIDDMTVRLRWDKVKGATGYRVRYGTASDKLYLSQIVYGTNTVTLMSLTKGRKYYAAVDVFNENGVTEGAVRVYDPARRQ